MKYAPPPRLLCQYQTFRSTKAEGSESCTRSLFRSTQCLLHITVTKQVNLVFNAKFSLPTHLFIHFHNFTLPKTSSPSQLPTLTTFNFRNVPHLSTLHSHIFSGSQQQHLPLKKRQNKSRSQRRLLYNRGKNPTQKEIVTKSKLIANMQWGPEADAKVRPFLLQAH